MPHSGHSPTPTGTAQEGGEPSFTDPCPNGEIAPKKQSLTHAGRSWLVYRTCRTELLFPSQIA